MSEVAEKLLSVVRALPEAEQREFAVALNESLSPPTDGDAEWDAELNRRWLAFQSGESPGIPAEEVYRQLRAEFRKPA